MVFLATLPNLGVNFGQSRITRQRNSASISVPTYFCRTRNRTLFENTQRSKPFLWSASLVIFSSFVYLPAIAQSSATGAPYVAGLARRADFGALPDAPQAVQTPGAPISPQPIGGGSITGTVLDTNGDVLQGARVTLFAHSNSSGQAAQSGMNGQFAFTGLPPDVYTVTVTAPGMIPFKSSQITLSSGESRILPVTLSVSGGATRVNVTENAQQLSVEQMHIAEQQRIAGVIPNFYSAYDWNAPPMQAKQKFQLGLRSVFDPVSFLAVAGVAGAEQYQNIFPSYGGGFEGYSKRYGAAFANHFSGTMLGRAVFPAIFHQDPRYFYKGTGSIRSRAFYAISAAVIARGDNGHWQPNYSLVVGNFSAAALSNLYYPASDRGASLVIFNGLASVGADAASNLLREFILKKITSHAHKQDAP